jgi:hypothetical protein
MDELAVVGLKGLRNEFGIVKSPTQINRDISDGKFPKPLVRESPKEQRLWYRAEIREHLRRLGDRRKV